MTCSSCLLLGEPDTTPPTRTRPELRALGPAPTEVYISVATGNAHAPIDFTAEVRSEDAGDELETILLIDYGQSNALGTPWLDESPVSLNPSGPATLSDGWRFLKGVWLPQQINVGDPECHTVTMVVSHQFEETLERAYCPADPEDVARITWFVHLCQDPTGETCPVTECAKGPDTDNPYCDSPQPDGGT